MSLLLIMIHGDTVWAIYQGHSPIDDGWMSTQALTILLFLLGLVLARIKSIADVSDRTFPAADHYVYNIRELIEDCRTQAGHIKTLADLLKKEQRVDVAGTVEPFPSLPVLLDAPMHDMYLYVVRSKRGSLKVKESVYRELRKGPRSVKNQLDDHEAEFGIFRPKYDVLHKDWQESINALLRLIDSWISDAAANDVGSVEEMLPMHREAVQTRRNWSERTTSDLEITNDALLKPLRNLAKNYIGRTDSIDLLVALDRAEQVYSEFHNTLSFFGGVFERQGEGLSTVADKMQGALASLAELKPKRRWYTPIEWAFRQWKKIPADSDEAKSNSEG